MTDTHTPGPWMPQFVGGRWSIWAGSDHPKVCQLGVLNEDNKADAHLIAAAPNLLEAVKTALPAIVWAAIHTGGNAVQFAGVESVLRNAIAKTEPKGGVGT